VRVLVSYISSGVTLLIDAGMVLQRIIMVEDEDKIISLMMKTKIR
jgi:hypothetical protein